MGQMRQAYLPSADLLLRQYIRLAQDFTDAATPQDNFLATIASDWRYERALQGIRLLAQHHLGHLVQALIAWRQNVNEDIKKNFSQNNVVNLQGVCKRAAMEILFLEAAIQVLDEFMPDFWRERHFQTFFDSMQHVSFRWLLNSEEYVPHQELTLVRQHVVLVSARIVGALSRIKLSDVTATFVKKLEERVNSRKDMGPRTDQNLLRSQALKLCAGMRGIVLSFDNDSQLEQSTRFLQKAHPLNYTAAVKKSQVHHALSEMLTDILTPLVRSNQPHGCTGLSPALMAEWYNQVLRLKDVIGQWANKHNKHIMVGYPLVTVLVCLADSQNYSPLVDSMADFLAKQMKNKEYRSLCFKCLNQLVISSLVRNSAAASSPQVVAWLDKIVKPGLANARKGGISVQEQQDFLADMADLNPEYCVGSIIMDLLQSDSTEAQLIALRTLHLVATSVPQDSTAALELRASTPRRSLALSGSINTGGGGSSGKRLVQLPAQQVLDLIRNGQHPFELQGIAHLLPRVQQHLAQLLVQYHRSFGPYLSFSSDGVPKDKQVQLNLFSGVVRLVPYLKPEQWPSRPLDLLPSYTAHAEGSVRLSAFDALMGTVRGCPVLRNVVLSNMAVFLGAIPDEAAQAIQECLLQLRKLMESWLRLLQEQRLASSSLHPGRDSTSSSNRAEQQQQQQQTLSKGDAAHISFRSSKEASNVAAGSATAASLMLDMHRLEGVLFTLLCSYDESIRCEAYSVLALLRLLHQQLCAMAEQLGIKIGSGVQPQQQLPSAASAAAGWGPGLAAVADAGGGSFTSTTSSQLTGVQESVASGFAGTPSASSASLQVAASAGPAAAGGGIFSRHKPTMSRDSFEFMQTLGQLETPDAGVTCIMDVLEEIGTDVARRCYWDFGDWSDLWRETKHVPLDVSLQSVMGATDELGRLRWMRCIVELARAACHMCPTSMGVAYMEMLHKLSRHLTRDSSGRIMIPTDSVEGRRNEAWKCFVVVACVCPPSLWERVERAAARKGTGLTGRELIRSLLASLTAGSAIPQQVCLMALGHASPEHYTVLFEELPSLIDEYQRPGKQRRGTARPEEARKVVANVMRLVADAMAPGTLAAQPLIRSRFLDWLRDTTLYLRSLPNFGEVFWEVSQVAYCLCAVCRCVAGQLVAHMTLPLALLRDAPSVQRASSNKSTASDAPSTPPGAGSGQALGPDSSIHGVPGVSSSGSAAQPMTRKLLFEMFAMWCEEGTSRGAADYHARLSAGINTSLARVKDYDTDTREGLRQELAQSAELLDQAARLAMAAMLQGPVFDTDARRTQGPVLSWIDRLLQAPPIGVSAGRVPCVPKDSVGRSALFNLLNSNLDMFSVCVDRCYDRDARIATGSFQVVSEAYALNPVKVEPHVVLSLVLYKMVDSSQEVREDALHMLHVLSTREWQASAADMAAAAAAGVVGAASGWKEHQQQQEEAFALEAEGGSGTVVVLGALQDSYQQFQFQLAVKLARDHPELSEALCEEMMTRQLELADKVSQHPVLTCLGPWMENLTIAAHWKGTWCERLLKSMYYVTLRHGDELPLEIERLWSTLAGNRRNIIPILDFLASLGTHMAYQELNAMLEYLGVSKRICLYLARISPQQTIDHLVYEISLQLHEEEGSAGPGGSNGAQLLGSCQHGGPTLQFARVLVHDAAGHDSPARAPAAAAAAADAPGLLRSSASSWWAYNSTSSLASTAAAAAGGSNFPSTIFPGSSYPGASSSTTGAGTAGAFGGMGIGVGSSYPPAGAPAAGGLGAGATYSTQGASTLATHESSVGRAMHLSSTFTSAFGIGSSSATAAGGTELREGALLGLSGATGASSIGGQGGAAGAGAVGGMRRSVTEHSDSTRSSLSLTGQGSSTTIGVADHSAHAGTAAAGGLSASSSSLAAAAAGAPGNLPGLPRQINAGMRGGGAVLTSSDFAGGAAAGSSSFNLGSYFATGVVAGSGQQGSTGMLGRDDGRSALDRRGSAGEPASPVLRGLMTRPELALCLLTEVAYEHDEDFSSHLALLCHVSLLLVDHEEQLVAAAAQQLLINCLYSLSARYLELMQEEGQQVECLQATHLIKYLQCMKGRRLWSYEDLCLGQQQELPSATALAGLVQHCLDALSFEAGLNEAWCGVALEWALHAHNRHLACRSQQVLRALRPPLTGDMCSTLLTCLQQCLSAADASQVAREVALELLLTLRSLLEVLPARKLLLYPQVFWSSLSLLFSSYVHIYQQALILLTTCLQQLPLHDNTTQNVLLAAAPAADPGELQQLLARTQYGSSWLCDPNKSVSKAHTAAAAAAATGGGGGAVDDPGGKFGSWCESAARLKYSGTTRMRSPTPQASPGAPGSGSALASAAHPGMRQSVSSSLQSFVGGADPDGLRPMPWPVGQLLPWPERGSDGPAHHMIAVQQVLFKGLLFPHTQLPTVQLLSLLARGLCQLPASPATPIQADGDRDGWVRDQSTHLLGDGAAGGVVAAGFRRASTPVSSSASSSRTGSRATTGTPPRSGSRDSPAVTAAGSGPSGRPRSARFVGASLQQEHLLTQAAGQHRQQQQQPHIQHQQDIAGDAAGSCPGRGPDSDAASVSRSAPELRGFGAASSSSHCHTTSSSALDTRQPLDGSSRHQHQQPDRGSGKRWMGQLAASGDAGAAGLCSSWAVWSSLLAGGTGSAAAGTKRKLPGSRAVFQSLLGHRHAQLMVTVASFVPFFCSQLGQLEPDSELLEALQECMLTLSAACSTQGLTELGSKLQQFTTSLNVNSDLSSSTSSSTSSAQRQRHQKQQDQPAGLKSSQQGQLQQGSGVSSSSSSSSSALKRQMGAAAAGIGSSSISLGGLLLSGPSSPSHSTLLHLLQGLCLQLNRVLLPTFADWLLRFWVGVLLLPGAAALHPHVLLLLRCLFDTPGLQLGPAVALLVDSAFISPIVNLNQGPLCQYALDALDAIIHYAANSAELQQYQQQHGLSQGLHLSSSSSSNPVAAAAAMGMSPLAAAAAAAGAPAGAAAAAAAGGPGVDLQGLAACLLPQLDVVELLQRVLDSCAAGVPKRRKYRLLPFLSDSVMGGQQADRSLED